MNKSKLMLSIISLLCIALLSVGGYLLYDALTQGEKGEKAVTVTIERAGEATKTLQVRTDTEKLVDLLDELVTRGKMTYAAGDSPLGKYIISVEGYTPNGDNEEWWGIKVDGVMAQTGVSSIPIKDGETYTLILMVGW